MVGFFKIMGAPKAPARLPPIMPKGFKGSSVGIPGTLGTAGIPGKLGTAAAAPGGGTKTPKGGTAGSDGAEGPLVPLPPLWPPPDPAGRL